jgi:uncharacterized membrane protein (UPF0127 family)
MLFIFQRPGIYSIWMRGMLFPLDNLWIEGNLRVVHIVKDAQPCPPGGSCPVYTPDTEALYVLELPAGFVSENGVSVGMMVGIQLHT